MQIFDAKEVSYYTIPLRTALTTAPTLS